MYVRLFEVVLGEELSDEMRRLLGGGGGGFARLDDGRKVEHFFALYRDQHGVATGGHWRRGIRSHLVLLIHRTIAGRVSA